LKGRKKGAEIIELLNLDPVSLAIEKVRLRWFGLVEGKDETNWIKGCTTIYCVWSCNDRTVWYGALESVCVCYGTIEIIVIIIIIIIIR